MTTKKTRLVLLLAGLTACAPAMAGAQTSPRPANEDTAFVNISVGEQTQKRTIGTSRSFSLYDETATITGVQNVHRGLVLDVTAGRRLRPHLFVAVGVSTFHGSGDASVVSSIPDPVAFNHFATTTTAFPALDQTTLAVNPQIVWLTPLSDTLDVAISAGPSLMRVTQDLPAVAVVSGTQQVSASSTSESAWTAKAGNVGVDFGYKVGNRHRVGLFVRYAAGEVDLPSAPKTKVGGLQVGLGLRLRF